MWYSFETSAKTFSYYNRKKKRIVVQINCDEGFKYIRSALEELG